MLKKLFLLCLLPACLFRYPVIAADAGGIEGAFTVDANGGAVYTIPIEVPPGINGVEPNLALQYHSQAGDGILGVGWNLTGLSAVTRVGQIERIDGRYQPVRFDRVDKDRLSLHGQRLVAVADKNGNQLTTQAAMNAAYGRDGTVYRTERESWTKVIGHGDMDDADAWFEVHLKTGASMEFGRADNAAATHIDGRIRAWGLNRNQDINGNYIRYQYQTGTPGYLLVSRIDYTGNGSDVAPKRSVRFDYRRFQTQTRYIAGKALDVAHQLTTVTAYLKETPVTRYRLTYALSDSSNRSLVQSVERCGYRSDATWSCFEPTEFSWQDPGKRAWAARDMAVSGLTDLGDLNQTARFIDWNLDGWTDILYMVNAPGRTYRSQVRLLENVAGEDGTRQFKQSVVRNLDFRFLRSASIWVVDMNGDGRLDYLFKYHDHDLDDAGKLAMVSRDSNGQVALNLLGRRDPNLRVYTTAAEWVTDMNGDGMIDIAYMDDDRRTYYVQYGDGTGFAARGTRFGSHNIEIKLDATFQWLADVNGDTLPDLILVDDGDLLNPDDGDIYVMRNLGDRFAAKEKWYDAQPGGNAEDGFFDRYTFAGQRWITDINGDGLADVVFGSSGTGQPLHGLLSTGTTFVETELARLGNDVDPSQDRLWFGDANNDKAVDIFWRDHSAKKTWVFYNRNGVPNFDSSPVLFAEDGIDSSLSFMADLNLDGRVDQLLRDDDRDTLKLIESRSPLVVEAVYEVKEPFGGGVRISYRPLSQARYGGAQPFGELIPAPRSTVVVNEYTLKPGLGTDMTYSMGYMDGMIHPFLGFAGFGHVSRLNNTSNINEVREYHQSFPKTGTVAREYTQYRWSVIEETRFTVAAETTANDWVWMVHNTQVVSGRKYAGGKTFQHETEMTYDAYGNLLTTWRKGDPDDTADDRVTVHQYQNNEADWMLGFPSASKTMARNSVPTPSSVDFSRMVTGDLALTRFGYDTHGNRTKLETYLDESNRWAVETFTYDRFGNQTGHTNALGNTTTVTYDAEYHSFPVTTRFPAAGLTQTTSYAARWGETATTTDANGNQTRITYDAHGRPTAHYAPNPQGRETLVKTLRYAFDRDKGYYVETRYRDDWNGSNTADWTWERVYYDGLLREIRQEAKGPSPTKTRVTRFKFDAAGRLVGKTPTYFADEGPAYSVIRYGDRGLMERIDEPNGSWAKFSYGHDLFGEYQATATYEPGRVGESTSAILNTWHDVLGREIRKRSPDGTLSTLRYDAMDRLIEQDGGGTGRYRYNSRGLQTRIEEDDTGTKTLAYDAHGRLTRTTHGTIMVRFGYDAMDRVTSEEHIDNRNFDENVTYTLSYDASAVQNGRGQLTKVMRDRDPATWTMAYDTNGNLTHTAVEVGFAPFATAAATKTWATSRTFDPRGRLRRINHPDGSVVEHTYGGEGHLAQIRLKESGESSFKTLLAYDEYSGIGLPGRITHGNGLVTRHGFDSTGRLLSRSLKRGNTALLDTRYQWNNANLITAITEGAQTNAGQSFQYDNALRLTKATGIYGTIDYSYDGNGNLMSRNDTQFTYDLAAVNQVISASSGHQFSYDRQGRRNRTELNDGSAFAYTWSSDGMMRRIRHRQQRNGAWQDIMRATYDVAGQLLSKWTESGETTLYLAEGFEVVHTASGRYQTTLNIAGPSKPEVAVTRAGQGRAASKWHQGGMFDPGSAAGLWFWSLSRGETALTAVADSPWTFPLVAVALSSAWLALFALLGLRAAHRRSRLGRLRSHLARWAPARLNTVPVATDYLRRHTPRRAFGNGLLFLLLVVLNPSAVAGMSAGANGAGVPVAGTVRYFHSNQVFSTSLVTDGNGQVTATMHYTPYGMPVESSGTDDFRPKFGGKEYLAKAQLYDFGARYYDPLTASFLTPDPEGQFLSPYTFTNGNPTSAVDPDGRLAMLLFFIVLGGLIGAYMGGVAVNGGNYNPVEWDWSSGKTWKGLLAGFLIGAVAGAIGTPVFASGNLLAMAAFGTLFGGIEAFTMGAINGYRGSELFGYMVGGFIAGGLGGLAFGTVGKLFSPLVRAGRHAFRFFRSSVAKSVRSVRAAPRALTKVAQCFTEKTEVVTEDGRKPIAEIAVGDRVWSWNEETGRTETNTVTRLFRNQVNTLVTVDLGDQQIETTTEHPFYVQGEGWIEAEKLKPGDLLIGFDGRTVEVNGLRFDEGVFRVYNFEVAGAHTYFVNQRGAELGVRPVEAVLVHNLCIAERARQIQNQYVRSGLRSADGKNIAVARFRVKGGPVRERVAVSGAKDFGVDGEVSFQRERFFKARVDGWDRSQDTEIKILDYIHRQIRRNPKVKGNLEMFTPRAPCRSCSRVIRDFRSIHPNINLKVTHAQGRINEGFFF
ncbi:HintN domain-containing protein [Acanthopleuribacter pedis]